MATVVGLKGKGAPAIARGVCVIVVIAQERTMAVGATSGIRCEQAGDAPPAGALMLLVDDDVELCELLQEFFARRNIRLETVNDGRRGLARALGGGHDLLLLDVMMPGLDGFELLRLVRRQSQVPVIMLTARTTQADRVAGLDAGADDYLPKPFGTEELMARIRAVLRRAVRAPKESGILDVGALRLIPSARQVLAEGAAVAVTTVEYDILEFLVHSAGRIVSRDELTAALYQRRATKFDRTLDMHICNLRKKLGRHGDLIQTVRGVGYLCRIEPDGPGDA